MPSKLPTAEKISPPVGSISKSNWPTATVIAALSLCVAFSALLRPEIEQLLKSPKVEARLADQLVLSQRVGILWLTPFVELSNEGGKKASVRRVRMDIFGPDKLHILLNGESYLKRNTATQAYFPLVNLQIPANDQWLDRINFREQMTQAEEESLRALMERLGKYWGLIADGPNERKQAKLPLQKVDDLLYKDAFAFFERSSKLRKGKYSLLISVEDGSGKILSKSAYDFVLHESHIKALRTELEDYFSLPSSVYDNSIHTEITLTQITLAERIEELYSLSKQRRK